MISSQFWEHAVEAYLTKDRGLFLKPQYIVGEVGTWYAKIDFLAICFPQRTVWMVEVTNSGSACQTLSSKIVEFHQQYVPRIRDQIVQDRVIDEARSSEWKVGFWAFVQEDHLHSLMDLVRTTGIREGRITSLQEAVFSW